MVGDRDDAFGDSNFRIFVSNLHTSEVYSVDTSVIFLK